MSLGTVAPQHFLYPAKDPHFAAQRGTVITKDARPNCSSELYVLKVHVALNQILHNVSLCVILCTRKKTWICAKPSFTTESKKRHIAQLVVEM